MFYTLRSALASVTDGDIVVAEDVSDSGQKQFRVGTINALNSIYSTLNKRHWYECLVENKASRLFLDVESTTCVNIAAIVAFFKRCVELQFVGITATFEIIDSCSPAKYSWHVVCTNVFLKNVYHVGAFVRRVVMAMQDSIDAKAVDTAVYTKNRMFRIVGSTKFASKRMLKHDTLSWSSLLVQVPTDRPILECLELDGSIAKSTSAHPSSLFRFEDGRWVGQFQIQKGTKIETSCPLLCPVLDWLDSKLNARVIRHKLSMTDRGLYVVPCESTRCEIAGRCHKGCAIWFGVDILKQSIYQRCLDEVCGRQSCPVSTPNNIWDLWNHEWQQLEPPPKQQKDPI